MKRVVIVHCWDGYPEYCWYPYVKRELEARGFEVMVPAFPETDAPNLEKWLPVLEETAGDPDQNLFLIGHSVGCITIMRYLESLGTDQKVGGVVFVAGFADNLGFKELENFFITPIDFDHIKERAARFLAIHSDDDPYVPLTHGDTLKEKLGAEIVVKHGFKHFSGPVDKEESCVELPEVVSGIMEMSNR